MSFCSQTLVLYHRHFFIRRASAIWVPNYVSNYSKSESDSNDWVAYSLDREYKTVCPLFDDPYKFTYLVIRSTNHGGLSQNAYICSADSVFSSVGLSSCTHSYSTTKWSPASPFSSSSQLFSCFSCVLRSLCYSILHWFDPIYNQIAMLSSMCIYPPRICDHRRKTLDITDLSTLSLLLPLPQLLVFSERNDTLGRCFSNIRKNWVFQGFPSWI